MIVKIVTIATKQRKQYTPPGVQKAQATANAEDTPLPVSVADVELSDGRQDARERKDPLAVLVSLHDTAACKRDRRQTYSVKRRPTPQTTPEIQHTTQR